MCWKTDAVLAYFTSSSADPALARYKWSTARVATREPADAVQPSRAAKPNGTRVEGNAAHRALDPRGKPPGVKQ